MATEGQSNTFTAKAEADVSMHQHKAVNVAGGVAAANAAAAGILLNKPKLGEHATIAYSGHMKAYVGGTITAGNRLKVTSSGFLVVALSSEGSCGKAISACASGSICEFIADFANAALF